MFLSYSLPQRVERSFESRTVSCIFILPEQMLIFMWNRLLKSTLYKQNVIIQKTSFKPAQTPNLWEFFEETDSDCLST